MSNIKDITKFIICKKKKKAQCLLLIFLSNSRSEKLYDLSKFEHGNKTRGYAVLSTDDRISCQLSFSGSPSPTFPYADCVLQGHVGVAVDRCPSRGRDSLQGRQGPDGHGDRVSAAASGGSQGCGGSHGDLCGQEDEGPEGDHDSESKALCGILWIHAPSSRALPSTSSLTVHLEHPPPVPCAPERLCDPCGLSGGLCPSGVDQGKLPFVIRCTGSLTTDNRPSGDPTRTKSMGGCQDHVLNRKRSCSFFLLVDLLFFIRSKERFGWAFGSMWCLCFWSTRIRSCWESKIWTWFMKTKHSVMISLYNSCFQTEKKKNLFFFWDASKMI